MSLSRISESSSSQEASLVIDLKLDPTRPGLTSQISTGTTERKSSLLNRKSSFDLSLRSSQTQESKSQKEPLRSQLSVLLPDEKSIDGNQTMPSKSTSSPYSSQTKASSIDPSQVFLQLFRNQSANDKDQPLLIPDIPNCQRSINLLDFMPCYLIHKIGKTFSLSFKKKIK